MANNGRVSALETAIAVLEALEEREYAGVSELAETLGMSKANVHKHLTTLQAHGFVTRDGSAYRLGLRFFELGVTARDGGPLYQESAPKVVELAEITNQTATLLVPNGEAGVYVASVNPERESRSGELEGERRPLHETASGRAVLARYTKTERSELLSSAADSGELRDRLARIEEREVAVGEAPGHDDRRELAAPIVTGHRTPIGAVALLVDPGADGSSQVERNYRQLVTKTGETLSRRMRLRSDRA